MARAFVGDERGGGGGVAGSFNDSKKLKKRRPRGREANDDAKEWIYLYYIFLLNV